MRGVPEPSAPAAGATRWSQHASRRRGGGLPLRALREPAALSARPRRHACPHLRRAERPPPRLAPRDPRAILERNRLSALDLSAYRCPELPQVQSRRDREV